jgi:type I restriction enzyme S subunit
LEIPLPPPSEQRRIVEVLDQADALRRKRAEADAKAARILPALFYKMFGDPATNPKKWPVKQLGDPKIAAINPKSCGEDVSTDKEFSFVPMADVDEVWGRIVGRQVRTYSDVMRGFTSFQEDDVLFAKITPCMQNGKAAIARNLANGRGFGSTEFHVLRAGPLAVPEWLFALVRLPWFRRQAESSFTGTAGQQRVPADFLVRYEIGCPPPALQRKFGKALAQIEHWVRRTARSRDGLGNLFGLLLHRAFTGDLTAKWREAHMKELMAEMEAQARALGSLTA